MDIFGELVKMGVLSSNDLEKIKEIKDSKKELSRVAGVDKKAAEDLDNAIGEFDKKIKECEKQIEKARRLNPSNTKDLVPDLKDINLKPVKDELFKIYENTFKHDKDDKDE